MKRILTTIFALALVAGACSDDDDEVAVVPEVPETDTDISISAKNGEDWKPGMEFAAYPGMPAASPGKQVDVLVIDADEHAGNIMHVLKNEAWPWVIEEEDKPHIREFFFPTHPDIRLHVTGSYDEYNPEHVPCDIVNTSFSVFSLDAARRNMDRLEDKTLFPEFPLVVTSAGNGDNTFTSDMWQLCQELGGLSWEDHILPHFGWDREGPFTGAQLVYYKPGDVGAAYAVQDPDRRGHAQDWIIVGRSDGMGNKPGPVLMERWICTYYSFDILDAKIDGTSFSTPYVAKIAAEIKRRAPHYTNDDIARLIFSTADDLGSPGCDEVYGNGRLNPAAIWKELARRGY